MPADRLIHPKCGKSHKVSMLTDLAFRVWVQYLLSADDFGVMHGTAVELQSGNLHLANRPAKMVKRCLDDIVTAGLVQAFEHQGQPYVFQHDWQKYQKVEYPRATDNPAPTGEALALCDAATIALFAKHPGGQRKDRRRTEDVPSDSGRASQTNPEDVPPTRASAPAERLTANGLRPVANGSEARKSEMPSASMPIGRRRNLNAAWECERGLYVPTDLHSRFIGFRNGNEREVLDFYQHVADTFTANVNPDMFKFWNERYAEQWPPTKPTAVKGKHDDWVPRDVRQGRPS